MNEKEVVTLKVDESLIKPVIQKQIEAAIIANIGDPTGLIEKIVKAMLAMKTDENGNVNKDSYYNKYDMIETLCKTKIQQYAKEAMNEWFEQHKPKIKQSIEKELNKRQNKIVQAFISAATDSVNSVWNFHCNINLTKNKGD